MPRYFAILLLLLISTVFGCNETSSSNEQSPTSNENTEEPQTSVNLKSMEWIVGEWSGEFEGKVVSEVWKRLSDEKFIGKSGEVENGDTSYFELLTLSVVDNEIFYTADVTENKEAVSFKLISDKPNRVIFENKEHDFPQRIIYTYNEPDDLHIELKGKIDSVRKEMELFYTKTK